MEKFFHSSGKIETFSFYDLNTFILVLTSVIYFFRGEHSVVQQIAVSDSMVLKSIPLSSQNFALAPIALKLLAIFRSSIQATCKTSSPSSFNKVR